MNLPQQDANLFYRLIWSLHSFVNRQLGILPQATSPDAYAALAYSDKVRVRDALYEHIGLVDAFVEQNPEGLSLDELAIARSWKRFVPGDFFVERFLSRATIFVGTNGAPRVYAVLGLLDSLRDILSGYPLPIRVRTVLLPFRDKIIYDGIVSIYSIYFGSGIRDDLKEVYMEAKQNGQIVETLEPGSAPPRKKQASGQPTRDLRLLVDEVVNATTKLKGGGSPVQSSALSLLKGSVHLVQAAVDNPSDLDTLWEMERRVHRALLRFERVLGRVRQ